MRVLVVDDSKAMRMIIKRALRQAELPNLEVAEAENGRRAYDAIKGPDKFDLILCDWNMPVMSGIELLRKLNAERFAVSFGFVTSESTAAMRSQAREAGALFLLTKPFTAGMLKEHLDRAA